MSQFPSNNMLQPCKRYTEYRGLFFLEIIVVFFYFNCHRKFLLINVFFFRPISYEGLPYNMKSNIVSINLRIGYSDMKNLSYGSGIAGILIILLICGGCGAGDQFVNGLAAISGKGGKIARHDSFDKTAAIARKLNKNHPQTKWETVFTSEGADFISFLDNKRVLVGTVESGSYLGVPRHGDIKLFNAASGEQIWSAGRDGLKSGQYVLLTTEPLIVLVGRDDDVTEFSAYDPASGSKQWKHRVKAPDSFIVTNGLSRIISLSASGDSKKIEALDINTGKITWDHNLSVDSFSKDMPAVLTQGEEGVFAAGKKIIGFAEKDGSIIWSKDHPALAAKDRSVNYTPEGILVYNSQAMALLKAKDGSTRWESSLKIWRIRCGTVLNKKVYRVITRKKNAVKTSSDIIQALSSKNGKVIWSKRISGEVVSSLYMEKDILAFTTDKAVYGLSAATGKQCLRNPFSKSFISGCPHSAKTLIRPDIIMFRSARFYVAREMSGIGAYAFPSGKKLWEQMNYNYKRRGYSPDRLYTILARNLRQKTPQQPLGPVARPVFGSRSNSPSTFIQSAQRRYESDKQRTSAVLSNRYATRGDRSSAHRQRAMNARLMAAQQQVDMAMSRMQAAGDLLVAVVGLQGAIKNALKIATIQGVISRKYMELRRFMSLQQACFQGKYYVWPFYEQGRGVTLVDLDTGKRNDLLFSPHVDALQIFGVDLPTFCIGPDGKTLVMVGVGMNPARYEKYVKWKYRMPKPSVLAYDVSAFDFMKKSLTQKRAEEAAIEAKKKAETMVKEMQDYYDKSKMHSAAQAGNLKLVKSMLDSGVDPNVKHPHDESGPLVFAILGGHANIARLLITRGANVNEKTKGGKSMLFWAKHFKHKDIVKMLKDAGAR